MSVISIEVFFFILLDMQGYLTSLASPPLYDLFNGRGKAAMARKCCMVTKELGAALSYWHQAERGKELSP